LFVNDHLLSGRWGKMDILTLGGEIRWISR
jgi:hypothetical protein